MVILFDFYTEKYFPAGPRRQEFAPSAQNYTRNKPQSGSKNKEVPER